MSYTERFCRENKPGDQGMIGGDAPAKAPADGSTLLFNASTFTTAPMTASVALAALNLSQFTCLV